MNRFRGIFDARKRDGRFNTSYPLNPQDWAMYRIAEGLPFPDKELSFYVHIPFCNRLCSFCEYIRAKCDDPAIQKRYVQNLRNDIFNWMDTHPDILLRGFDIGGGTPTALCDEAFEDMMNLFCEVKANVNLTRDFEPSIEGTFQSVSKNKLEMISAAGIHRLSLGIQSTSADVLRCGNREVLPLEEAVSVRNNICSSGILMLNIDLMYGLKGQSVVDCCRDIEWIKEIAPEQVTLYEFRPNIVEPSSEINRDKLFEEYSSLFKGITSLGYKGEFSANTFSKNVEDHGLSSYLRSRMYDGISYKGFGISAQSMSSKGISYNIGKRSNNIRSILDATSFSEEDTYILPKEELVSKYVAIAGYGGQLSVSAASRLLGRDFLSSYSDILDWLQSEGYIVIGKDTVHITEKGFKYGGTVFSMIYSRID